MAQEVKVVRLKDKSPHLCTACGVKAVITLQTVSDWEHKRGKHTVCFSLCENHGLELSKYIYMQATGIVPGEQPAPQPPQIVVPQQ